MDILNSGITPQISKSKNAKITQESTKADAISIISKNTVTKRKINQSSSQIKPSEDKNVEVIPKKKRKKNIESKELISVEVESNGSIITTNLASSVQQKKKKIDGQLLLPKLSGLLKNEDSYDSVLVRFIVRFFSRPYNYKGGTKAEKFRINSH